MLITPDRDDLHKIVVVNPKGGSGKTTLATNIAGYYAMRGPAPTLMDCDPQGFSMRWLDERPHTRPHIHGIAAHAETASVARHAVSARQHNAMRVCVVFKGCNSIYCDNSGHQYR